MAKVGHKGLHDAHQHHAGGGMDRSVEWHQYPGMRNGEHIQRRRNTGRRLESGPQLPDEPALCVDFLGKLCGDRVKPGPVARQKAIAGMEPGEQERQHHQLQQQRRGCGVDEKKCPDAA